MPPYSLLPLRSTVSSISLCSTAQKALCFQVSPDSSTSSINIEGICYRRDGTLTNQCFSSFKYLRKTSTEFAQGPRYAIISIQFNRCHMSSVPKNNHTQQLHLA
ncbi:PREDICTED: uncharacterized protein LOC104604142 isoform X3 [Nelumbo nucifera]|uniref:Uncharacterized protein LOC104604142 isoform X3 n=1 Tax=Nelumbo nucifera TaxID=4432 RepID=A0A1U8Q8P1_NELNU|nr:PREDICTED: uncharacterized protein LOC104604142 isoform X3 [Nelumbo nucifera]